MSIKFVKAERSGNKLRLALGGISGSGKTTGALMIATSIAKHEGGRVAVVDTERRSSALYSDQFDFDILDLCAPYEPEKFIEAITAAEDAGYSVLVIDSMSHEWGGPGGCLDIKEHLGKTKFKGNTWAAWSDVQPRHQALLDKIVMSKIHIIVTLRMKVETVQDAATKRVHKLGMKYEMKDNFEYEFTTVFDMTHGEHCAVVSKDRTRLFSNANPFPITSAVGDALNKWLNGNANYYMTDEHMAILKRLKDYLPADDQAKVVNKYPNFSDEPDARFEEMRNGLTKMITDALALGIDKSETYDELNAVDGKMAIVSEDTDVLISDQGLSNLYKNLNVKKSQIEYAKIMNDIKASTTLDDVEHLRGVIADKVGSFQGGDIDLLNGALDVVAEDIGAAG